MLTIFLPYPPSINQIFYTDFRTRTRHRSKEYRKWVDLSSQYLLLQKRSFFIEPVCVVYEIYKPDNRKRDLGNMEKALSDFLVSVEILKDDSLIYDLRLFWSTQKPSENWHGVKCTLSPAF